MSRRVAGCLVVALFVGLFSSCQKKEDAPEAPEAPCCDLQLHHLDFGAVPVGSSRDSFIAMTGCDETIADTVVMQCPGFRFIDGATGQPTDTFAYALDSSSEDTCYIRFEPESEGVKACQIPFGSDCGDVYLQGSTPATNYGWRAVGPVVSVDLHDVWGGQCDGFWVCGDSGTVLHSEAGASMPWDIVASHGFDNIPLKSVWKSGGGALWTAGGSWAAGGGRILYFDGATWHEAARGDQVMSYDAIWGASACDVYFMGVSIMSLDGFNGFRWNCSKFDSFMLDMGISPITGVFGSAANDVWAVLGQPASNAYHSNGIAWERKRETWMSQWLHDVWVALNGEAFAVGTNGAIYHFKGNAWTNESPAGITKTFYGVWGRSEADVFAVGEDAMIYHFDGSLWSAQAAPDGVTADLNSVWGIPMLDVYAVGTGGTIIRYGLP